MKLFMVVTFQLILVLYQTARGVLSDPLKTIPSVEETLPSFATSGRTLRIPTKDTVVFPCEVNNLGKFVLAWKKGNAILTAGPTKVSPDDRIRLVEGYNLEIRDVQTSDAGDYICHIATLKPREITHTLEVLVPPRIQRTKTGSMVEVRKGTMVTLDCEASGNPVPTITWTRKNNLLPSGEKSFTGPSYTIEQTNRHHSGTYICTASNGVGSPAQEQTNLVVHYPPEIEVEKDWVHTGEGREAELVCIVHAEPPAEVHWYRNTLRLDITERRITETRGSRHTLIIRKVHSGDFGNYSCFADNAIGKNRQFVTLSGKPHPAVFRSNSNGKQKDMYNITWAVSSYTPIDEYKLSYRSVTEAPLSFQQHYASFPGKYDLKSGRKDGEVLYPPSDYDSSGARSRWKNVTLPITPNDQFTHQMSYVIQDLDPATQYEAKVIAKNRWGWSDPPREAFRFTTKGAETNPDSANDVYNSEPEMRDMGVKAMNEANQAFNSAYTKVFVAFVTMLMSNFCMSGL